VKLKPGDWIPCPPSTGEPAGVPLPIRSHYRVTRVVCETAWYGLYEGKKVFFNFNFGKRQYEPVADDECLNVFLKTLIYPRLDDREHVKARRDHAWREAKQILGNRKTNLLPEPLDFLTVSNTQDLFSFPKPGKEPVLVHEKIHGETLFQWRSTASPSPLRVLRTLAELLEFAEIAHGQKLLLNGINALGVWIDQMDRIHYLASEMVLDQKKQEKRHTLFPPDRYMPGFAAPEVSNPDQPLGARSDLFSWAALAYHLITGDNPAQIARNQGGRHARFGPPHFDRMREKLEEVSAKDLDRVCQWFRVGGLRFKRTWPAGFVAVLEKCLAPQTEDRPEDVGVLRLWWTTAPPVPLFAALAVHWDTGPVEILLPAQGQERDLEVVVRRGSGVFPGGPQEGQAIADCSLRARITDQQPLSQGAGPSPCYSVFTRVRENGITVHSTAARLPLLNLTQPDQLRVYAERVARETARPQDLFAVSHAPERLAVFEGLPDVASVCEFLLGSTEPLVRRWAICLLERQLRRPGQMEAVGKILWHRALRDSDPRLGLAAARVIFQGNRRLSSPLLLQVAHVLGGDDIDKRLAAVRSLAVCDLDAESIDAALRSIDADRPVACPECMTQFRTGDLPGHLQDRHYYILLGQHLLSYGAALTHLWDRLFLHQDDVAAQKLADLFIRRFSGQAPVHYEQAFRAQFLKRWQETTAPQDAPSAQCWQGLTRCLAAHELTRRVCLNLLRDPKLRLRNLAREVWVPIEASRLVSSAADVVHEGGYRLVDDPMDPSRLVSSAVDVAAFRRSVETLCPQDDLNTRIEVCHWLQSLGASASAAAACVRELELDRLTPCPHCQSMLRRREEIEHLRTAHGIYGFRNARLPYEEMLRHLVRCLFAAEPDAEAAQTFLAIAQERNGGRAAERLGASLLEEVTGRGDNFESPGRQSALRAVAALPVNAAIAEYLLHQGLSAQAGELGLALYAVMSERSPRSSERVADWLSQTVIPTPIRLGALKALLKTPELSEVLARRAAEQFMAGTPDKRTALRLLKTMDWTSVPNEVINSLASDLEASIRLKCPKCQVVLNSPQMREHVWSDHRLILDMDELRCREPWAVIRDLLDRYRESPDERALQYCLDLATRLDPRQGPRDLARLASQRGLDDPYVRTFLTSVPLEEFPEIMNARSPTVPTRANPLTRLITWCGRMLDKATRKG
jgi:hypothetical protein